MTLLLALAGSTGCAGSTSETRTEAPFEGVRIAAFCTGPEAASDASKPPTLGGRLVFDQALAESPELVQSTHAKLVEILGTPAPDVTEDWINDHAATWLAGRVLATTEVRQAVEPLTTGTPAERLFAALAVACVVDDAFDDISTLKPPSDWPADKKEQMSKNLTVAARPLIKQSTDAYRTCLEVAPTAPASLRSWAPLCKIRVDGLSD